MHSDLQTFMSSFFSNVQADENKSDNIEEDSDLVGEVHDASGGEGMEVEVVADQHEVNGLLKRVNPISTTTESVEHFHSLAHRKSQVQTVWEYIRSYSVIVKECAKSMSSWSFQLFSRKGSYYTSPRKNKIPLERIPIVPKLEPMNVLGDDENEKVRNFCIEYKALPQSSTRCFTSKFKAGTLPLQAYADKTTKKTTDVQEKDDIAEVSDVDDTAEVSVLNLYVDEDPEYDSGTDSGNDEEQEEDEDDVHVGVQNINENFVTRSGRKVGAPRKFMDE